MTGISQILAGLDHLRDSLANTGIKGPVIIRLSANDFRQLRMSVGKEAYLGGEDLLSSPGYTRTRWETRQRPPFVEIAGVRFEPED